MAPEKLVCVLFLWLKAKRKIWHWTSSNVKLVCVWKCGGVCVWKNIWSDSPEVCYTKCQPAICHQCFRNRGTSLGFPPFPLAFPDYFCSVPHVLSTRPQLARVQKQGDFGHRMPKKTRPISESVFRSLLRS